MVWPLILAGGMTVLAEILPKKNNDARPVSSPSAAAASRGSGYSNLIFTLGLATGVTLTAYFYNEAHRRRWFPYIYQIFLTNDDEGESKTQVFDNGVVVERLVSPSTDLTVNLYVTKITIPIGVSLQMDQRPCCLEFYYACKGTVTIVQTPLTSASNDSNQEQSNSMTKTTKLSSSGDQAQHLTLQSSYGSRNRLTISNASRLEDCIVLCAADGDDKGREMQVRKESLVAMGMKYVQNAFYKKR